MRIKKTGIPKAFSHWARKNQGRFRHPPYMYALDQKYLEIRFAGVSRRIYSVIDEYGSNSLWVNRNEECWNGLADFDAWYAQTGDGRYYCKLRKAPELFPSRDELLIRHSWELMMDWVEQHFAEDTYICLYGDEGMTYAALKPAEEVENERHKEFFIEAFPAMKRKPVKKRIGHLATLTKNQPMKPRKSSPGSALDQRQN